MEMVSSVPVAQQAMMITMMHEPLLKKLWVLLCMLQNALECASEHLKLPKLTKNYQKSLECWDPVVGVDDGKNVTLANQHLSSTSDRK